MGCCGCTYKVTCMFAGFFSVIQGLAWLILSILGVMMADCDIYTPDLSNPFGTFVVYFYNKECKPEIDTGGLIEWPVDVSGPSLRTQQWFTAYIILSTLWISTSIFLMMAVMGLFKKIDRRALLYCPWILVTAATLIADVIAAIMYGLDIENTQTLRKLLEFMGAIVSPGFDVPDEIGYLTTVPSIVFVIIFSRFGIFWITNGIFFIYVILAAMEAEKRDTKSPKGPRHNDLMTSPKPNPSSYPKQHRPPTSPEYIDHSANHRPPTSPAYIDHSVNYRHPTSPEYIDHSANHRPPTTPEYIDHSANPRPPTSPAYIDHSANHRPPTSPEYSDHSANHRPPTSPAYIDHSVNYRHPTSPEYIDHSANHRPPTGPQPHRISGGDPKREREPQFSGIRRNNSNYRPPSHPGQTSGEPEAKPSRLSNQGFLDRRMHHINEAGDDGDKNRRSDSNRVPPEVPKKPMAPARINHPSLRNSHPWSYTSAPGTALPKHIVDLAGEDEDKPPVPVPDYTLHIKRDRVRRTPSLLQENDVIY